VRLEAAKSGDESSKFRDRARFCYGKRSDADGARAINVDQDLTQNQIPVLGGNPFFG
jgi:predicted alpha/beta hydrolase